MTNEVDYLFMSLLTIQMFFFLKCLCMRYIFFKNLQDIVITTAILLLGTVNIHLDLLVYLPLSLFFSPCCIYLRVVYSPSLIYRIPWCRYVTIYLFNCWWVFIWVICQYCFLCTWRIYSSKVLLVANYSNCMKYCILVILEVSFSESSIGLGFSFSSLKLSFHYFLQSDVCLWGSSLAAFMIIFFKYLYF